MKATVGQFKWLGEVDAKRIIFDGLREVDATVGQLRLLGEVVTKVNNFDGLGEVVVLTWKLFEFEGSVYL